MHIGVPPTYCAALVIFLLSSWSSSATETCKLRNADYANENRVYALSFRPLVEFPDSATAFSFTIETNDRSLPQIGGELFWTNGYSNQYFHAERSCISEDAEECNDKMEVVSKERVYGLIVGAGNTIGVVDLALDDSAPTTIIMSNLARGVYYSLADRGIDIPGDPFHFDRCRQ